MIGFILFLGLIAIIGRNGRHLVGGLCTLAIGALFLLASCSIT